MLPETKTPIRALVVDDAADISEFVGLVLESVGCQVRYAANGDDALTESHRFAADVVYLDVDLPGQDGWLVCAKLKSVQPAPAVVLMTGITTRHLYEFAEFVSADDVLQKPFSADDVLRCLPHVTA